MKKQMINKSNEGITLIALVITIIILLILAGISISMLTGDNSILNQATNSAASTDISQIKEQIQIALIGYLGDNGYYTIEDVENAVTESGSTLNADGVTVTTAKGNEFDISDIIEGAYVPSITVDDIAENPTTYYGAVVINYEVADSTLQTALKEDEGLEWKIFYAGTTGDETEKHIYLIASDYLPVEYAPANSDGNYPVFKDSYTYSLYLPNVYSVYSGSSNIENTRLQSLNSLYFKKYPNSSSTNMKSVAYLMDTSIWNKFAGDYAEFAIGGPTLEMWIASWNQMGYTKLYCDEVNSYGYLIDTSENAEQYSVSGLGTTDILYFPRSSVYNKAYGYWIASPAGYSDSYCDAASCSASRIDLWKPWKLLWSILSTFNIFKIWY